MIPLPYRILAAALLAIGLVGSGYVAGLSHEQARWKASDALHAAQDTAQRLADTQAARTKEQALQAKLDAATSQRLQDQTDHDKAIASVRAAARAGTERLRCPSTALPASTAPDHPATVARPESEARPGDIVPASADDLFGIAGSIVEVVRQRNALIDAYNSVRATCNAQ